MDEKVVTVGDRDVPSHERAMRALGLQLVSRKQQPDQHSWRYVWSTTPPAAPIAPRPAVQPAAWVAPSPVAPAGGPGDLGARADALIAGYRATLRDSSQVPPDARPLVQHVVAVSAKRAARDTRARGADQPAERLEKYAASVDDPLGKLTDAGRKKAIDTAKDVLLGTTSLGTLFAHASWVLTVLLGLGALAFSFGAALPHSGSGLHLLTMGIAVVCTKTGAVFNQAVQQVRAAVNVSDPLRPLFARTLDEPERSLFAALGTRPPERPTLTLAGSAYATGLVLLYIGAAVAVALVAIGAFSAIAQLLQPLVDQQTSIDTGP
jgi:hypothetical protein